MLRPAVCKRACANRGHPSHFSHNRGVYRCIPSWKGREYIFSDNSKIVYAISEEEADTPLPFAASERKGEMGYVDKSMLARHLSEEEMRDSTFYICGRPAMLNAMQKLLSKEFGVPDRGIKVEVFTGY